MVIQLSVRNYLLLLILALWNLPALAQVKPIYFIGDSITSDQTKATSYGVSGKLSAENLYVLKLYDLDDHLMQTGFYLDEDLKIPTGRFFMYASVDDFNYENDTYFYIKGKERFLSEQGDYVDGKRTGRWIRFFPDGKIFSITTYNAGFKHGEFKVFTAKGKVKVSGSYKTELKDGPWDYDTGVKEIYVDGILTFRK